MKELVQYLARSLVNNPDAVEVKETQGETASVLELKVAKEDLGRIIGKQGRTAKSIRTILNAAASRANRRVVLEIVAAQSLSCSPTKVSARLIPLGEIVTTHGLDGWLKLKLYNPQTPTLSSTQKVFLEKGGASSPHWLEARKPHKGHLLLRLRGVEGINEAEKWVGAILSVAEEALQPPGPGEYYYYQVLGLDVFDTGGE